MKRKLTAIMLAASIVASMIPSAAAAGATAAPNEFYNQVNLDLLPARNDGLFTSVDGAFTVKNLRLDGTEIDMVPSVGATAEKYHLAAVSVQGNSASVRLMAEDDCSLFAAQYTEDGRMLGVSTAAVAGEGAYQTLSVPLHESEADFDLKVFLLDNTTRAPLCDDYVLKNAGTAGERYAIIGVDAEEDGLVATVSTYDACIMEVQIWDETEGELLFTTTAEAAEGLELELVSAEYETLPDHFLMRAVLKDEEGNAVSNPYTNNRNTQAFISFANQTEDDFRDRSDVTFLEVGEANDGNFMVLNSDVTYLDDTVGFTGESDGVLTFENAGAELTGLAAGELFAFMNSAGEYETVKIKEITVSDGVVSVTRDEKTYLSDFYDVIKINADLYYETGDEMPEAAALNAAAGTQSSQLLKIQYGSGLKTNLTLPIGSVEGQIRAGGKISLNYDPEVLGDDYMDISIVAGVKGEVDITIGAVKDWKDDMVIGSIPLAGLKEVLGAALNLEMVFEIDMDAGYNFTLEFENVYGFVYSTDTNLQIVRKTKSTQSEASSESKIKGEIDIEIGLRGELSLSLLDELVEASVGAEGGIAISGEIEVLSGTLPSGLDSYHTCALCLNGDCKTYFEIDVTLDYEITPWLKGNLMDLDFVRVETTIGAFYVSLINEEDSVHGGKIKFDWADECPNKKYKVKVITLDEEKQQVEGCAVTVTRDGEQKEAFSSPGSIHLYPGTYVASATIGQNYAETEFTVTEGIQTVYINGENNTLGGDVTNQLSGETISGVKVEISQNGTVINTTTTSNIGHYSQKLPDGIYCVKFSAEGYEDKVIQNVEVTDTKTLNVQLKPNMFTLTFDANGGSGTMEAVEFYAGQELALPSCEFTAPDDLIFAGWQIGEETYRSGSSYTMPGSDLQITAVWKENTSTITVNAVYEDGTPAVAACVEISDHHGNAVSYDAPEGTVSFEVPAGSYRLTVTGVDDTFAGQIVDAYGDKTITMTLKPCSFEWTLEGGVLTLRGSGPMPDYTWNGDPEWSDFAEDITSVVIDGLASVGNYACSYFTNLSSVSWGDDLLWIGDYAFEEHGLSSISIPRGVFSIGEYAFCGYGDSERDKLTSVSLPDTVKRLEKGAFSYQTNLSQVTGLENVGYLGDRVFYGCIMSSVNLGDKLTRLGSYAFYNSGLAGKITLPDSITSLGSNVFAYCEELTEVVLPDSIQYILGNLFEGCTALESVRLPGELITLGSENFVGCSSLKSIVLPDTLETIPYSAFEDCDGLEEITIPVSVTEIWSSAFSNTPNLKNVYYKGTQEQWAAIDVDNSGNTALKNATIHYNYTAE